MMDIKEDVYYLAIAHYAKNRMFMENGLKHYEEDMKTMKPDLRKLLDTFVTYDQEDKRPVMVDIIQGLSSEDVF